MSQFTSKGSINLPRALPGMSRGSTMPTNRIAALMNPPQKPSPPPPSPTAFVLVQVAIPLNQGDAYQVWQQTLYQWAMAQAQAQNQPAATTSDSDWLGVWN